MLLYSNLIDEVGKMEPEDYYGCVTGVRGLFIEVSGIRRRLSLRDPFAFPSETVAMSALPAAERWFASWSALWTNACC